MNDSMRVEEPQSGSLHTESSAAGPGSRKAPPVPCEQCGRDTEPWRITFNDGRRLCPSCVMSAAPPPPPVWRLPAIVGGIVLGLVVVGIAIYFMGKVPQKTQIAKSFHARTAAYRTEDEEVIADYTDYETVMQEIRDAAMRAGDRDPATTTDAIWVRFVGPATLSGRVVSVDGKTAIVERTLNKLPNGQPGSLVVRYQLEWTDREIWKVTHLLNADDLYESYAAAVPQ